MSFGTFSADQLIALSRPPFKVLLDSGAFTNFKAGKDVVKLDAYGAFLQAHQHRFWHFFNLDVIGNAERSLAHLNALRSAGLEPTPVYTPGAPVEEFDSYAQPGAFFAVGGVADTLKQTAGVDYARRCLARARFKEADVHLLGCGYPKLLNDLAPYSSDSSASSNASRYGLLVMYDQRAGKMVSHRQHWSISREAARMLPQYGITPSQVNDPEWWTTKKSRNLDSFSIVTFRAYIRMAKWFRLRGTIYFMSLFPPVIPYFLEACRLEGHDV